MKALLKSERFRYGVMVFFVVACPLIGYVRWGPVGIVIGLVIGAFLTTLVYNGIRNERAEEARRGN